MINEKARSSIMFAAEAPTISMFCDEGNHDRYAPTKHNLICQRKSTFEIIINHEDFTSNAISNHYTSNELDTRPRISYKKQNVTRYVLVIENTKDMSQRESWNFLKKAVDKWAIFDLPDNSEVGMVLTNDTGSVKMVDVLPMKNRYNREIITSHLLFANGDSSKLPCVHCALKEAQELLTARGKAAGGARNVIILIAPGINTNKEVEEAIIEIKKSKIRVVTINYPVISRISSLDFIAEATGGKSYTVSEKKMNIDTSNLVTYFDLSNVFYNIIEKFHSGNTGDLMTEIHRREIKSDGRSGRNYITGSFFLDDNMGEPARFSLYTHNTENLMLKNIKLTSPSHNVYSTVKQNMNNVKIISLYVNITEVSTIFFFFLLFHTFLIILFFFRPEHGLTQSNRSLEIHNLTSCK